MNIRKALQVKNKSAGDIAKKFEKIVKHNVYNQKDGHVVAYDTKKLLAEVISDTRNLAVLKSKIAISNVKIQLNIHLIAELKGIITKLISIPVDERDHSNLYAYTTANIQEPKQIVQISEVEVSELVKSLEDEIIKLQDEIEHHNSTVTIE